MKLQVWDFFEARRSKLSISPIDDPSHYEAMMGEVCSSILSPESVFDLRSQLSANGYVLVTTDIADFAPSTPTALTDDYGGPYYGEAMLCLVGQIVGRIQRIAHQNDGRAFHDVMPIEPHCSRQTSGSSAVNLEMHTELAFVDDPPDYLMLFCVRPDPAREAETILYDSVRALDGISAEQYIDLTKSEYRFGLDANISSGMDEIETAYSIFDAATSQLLRYDVDLYKSSNRRYDGAFDALTHALLEARVAVRLKYGQLLLVDNKRMVHSRTIFQANYDGNDRWLKRALVRRR